MQDPYSFFLSNYRKCATLPSLIDQAEKNVCGRKIEEALGDGAFDRKEIFDHLRKKEFNPS
jgi:hypothetical protein